MPNIHAYLPDTLYRNWHDTFQKQGIDPSKWIQEKFADLLNSKIDLQTIKRRLIEKKAKLESLKIEIEQDECLIADLEQAKLKKREIEQKEKEVIRNLDPHHIVNMTKGIITQYGIEDQKEARKLAIEYLATREQNKLTLIEFMKQKQKLEVIAQ